MNIKDLPINDRPREKALKYGIDSISNAELLSIFIMFLAIILLHEMFNNFCVDKYVDLKNFRSKTHTAPQIKFCGAVLYMTYTLSKVALKSASFVRAASLFSAIIQK